jgi:hypothetical protein
VWAGRGVERRFFPTAPAAQEIRREYLRKTVGLKEYIYSNIRSTCSPHQSISVLSFTVFLSSLLDSLSRLLAQRNSYVGFFQLAGRTPGDSLLKGALVKYGHLATAKLAMKGRLDYSCDQL